jgi:hypothetical protein
MRVHPHKLLKEVMARVTRELWFTATLKNEFRELARPSILGLLSVQG